MNVAGTPPFGPVPAARNTAIGFIHKMMHNGWAAGFAPMADDQLTGADLRGPTEVFNQVNIGLLLGHGTYGQTVDYHPSTPCKLTYFPIYQSGAAGYDWVRLDEMEFGSDSLRWMAILACNMLRNDQYQDMFSKGLLPINEKLHLLLSFETVGSVHEEFGYKWAQYMHPGRGRRERSIIEAFVQAAEETIPPAGTPSPSGGTIPQVDVRVAGWRNCWNDKVFRYQVPDTSGFLNHEDFKVNYE